MLLTIQNLTVRYGTETALSIKVPIVDRKSVV